VLRRIAGSAFALALFLPFVALSAVGYLLPFGSIWPMRYGGAYLLAWLTARHIDGARPRRAWVLFFVAGLATIDMLDFGLAALLATVAALLCARPPRSPRDARRLAGAVAGGVLGAVVVVTIFTLLRAGEPPRLAILLEWSRIFTGLGWFSVPVPRASLALAIYATFAATIAVAAVRIARSAHDALLTGMLAWIGVFGLVAGNYYVVRPDDIKLLAMFSAWGFAIALLTIVCVRALTARDWRAPAPSELLVLFGLALSICTIGRLYSPVKTISHLLDSPQPTYRETAEALVARHADRGDKVAILVPESYRIAYDLGMDNVSPYEMQNAIVTRRQMRTLLDAIRRERVQAIFTPYPGTYVTGDVEIAPEHVAVLEAAGFEPVEADRNMLAWRKAG
jgi:hypothetical protein